MDHSVDQDYRYLLKIVNRQRRRKLLFQLLRGGLLAGGVFLSGLAVLVLLDVGFQLDPPYRLALMLVLLGGTLFFLAREGIWPAIAYLRNTGAYSVEEVSREIGVQFPQIGDELLNTLQIYRLAGEDGKDYSLELIHYAVQRMAQQLRKSDFNGLYSVQSVVGPGRLLALPLIFFLFGLGIFPVSFRSALTHMLHPATQFKPVPVRQFLVDPGNAVLVEGDSCRITVKIDGSYRGPVTLLYREGNRKTFTNRTLLPDSGGNYRYLFAELRSPVHYFLRAARKVSPVFTLNVERRPFVRNLRLQLIFPAYTNLAPRFQDENVGDVTALLGTTVKLRADVNKALQRAELVFRNGRRLPLKLFGDAVRGGFTVRRETSYHIELVDKHGYANLKPIEYTVKPLPDQPPIVQITSPGKDVDLTEEMKLPLTVEAEDDFGFSRLRLGYRIQPSVPVPGAEDTTFHFISLPTDRVKDTRLAVDYLWDLGDLNLMPEDVVYYFAEVWDNDRITGPKRAISRVYTARFPSVYEIYEEVASGQDEKIDELEKALEEGKELKQKLDEIARELRQQNNIDWLKKQDLEDLSARQQHLQQQIESVKEDLQKMLERMQSNKMLSLETIKKFEELQKLFQEIMTPELQKALEELRKAFEQMDEEKLKQAMNKLQLSQDNLLRTLERTINLLKQLQLEQRMDQAAKLAENLAQRQKQLLNELKKSAPQELPSMLHQQQRLKEDAQTLSELLKQLDQGLREKAKFNSATMDSLLQEMQQVLSQMNRSEQNLQQGQLNQARKLGQLTEQDLRNMLSMLKNLKQNFVNRQKQEFMAAFNRASEELLRLSQAQENLMHQTRSLSPSSPQMGNVAESQQDLVQYLNGIGKQLYELSQKTFFVTPEIGRALGKSMAGMQRAIKNLEQRNPAAAAAQQNRAMGGLNETIVQIQAAKQSLKGASSAVGFEEYLKRLEQMAGRQQGINQQTLQLGGKGQLTLQQQAAMARLAAEQAALRKSLEELQREFGNRSEITGRLDGIARDMEQVVKDLQRKHVSPRTIERQKRILSRLLDAQRSMHKRDYSRKRESRPGKVYFVRSPSEIDQKVLQQRDRFLDDLIRARRAGFYEDYLELIRNYFDALGEKERKK